MRITGIGGKCSGRPGVDHGRRLRGCGRRLYVDKKEQVTRCGYAASPVPRVVREFKDTDSIKHKPILCQVILLDKVSV